MNFSLGVKRILIISIFSLLSNFFPQILQSEKNLTINLIVILCLIMCIEIKNIYNYKVYFYGYNFFLVLSVIYTINGGKLRFPLPNSYDSSYVEVLRYIIMCLGNLYIGDKLFFCKIQDNLKKTSPNKLFIEVTSIVSLSLIMIGIINFIFIISIAFKSGYGLFNFNYFQLFLKSMNYTTIGYTLFLPIGLYLYRYKLYIKDGKRKKYLFLVLIFIFARMSTGRITLTIMYIIIFLIIESYLTNNHKKINLKFYISNLFLIITAILFFYFRMKRGFELVGADAPSLEEFQNKLLEIIVGGGNTPNISILKLIMNEFGSSLEFLYGKSYFMVEKTINSIITEEYYFGLTSGNVPITIFGETYLNFGRGFSRIFFLILGFFMGYLSYLKKKSKNLLIKIIYFNFMITNCLVWSKSGIGLIFKRNLVILVLLLFYFFIEGVTKITVLLEDIKRNKGDLWRIKN